jgi:hypothetical protein
VARAQVAHTDSPCMLDTVFNAASFIFFLLRCLLALLLPQKRTSICFYTYEDNISSNNKAQKYSSLLSILSMITTLKS